MPPVSLLKIGPRITGIFLHDGGPAHAVIVRTSNHSKEPTAGAREQAEPDLSS